MWIKIHEQRIINSDHIGQILVTGNEIRAELLLELKTGEKIVHSYYNAREGQRGTNMDALRQGEARLASLMKAILETEERDRQTAKQRVTEFGVIRDADGKAHFIYNNSKSIEHINLWCACRMQFSTDRQAAMDHLEKVQV